MRREKLDWEREGKRGLVAFSFSINFLYFFYISILLVRDKQKKKKQLFLTYMDSVTRIWTFFCC